MIARMEHGELCSYDEANEYRVRRWLQLAPRIGDDIFLKLYSHGAQERHSNYLLEGGLERTLSLIGAECRRTGLDLRFATAWEMRQAVAAAVVGKQSLIKQQARAAIA